MSRAIGYLKKTSRPSFANVFHAADPVRPADPALAVSYGDGVAWGCRAIPERRFTSCASVPATGAAGDDDGGAPGGTVRCESRSSLASTARRSSMRAGCPRTGKSRFAGGSPAVSIVARLQSAAGGKRITKHDPVGSFGRYSTLAPCRSAIIFTRCRPSPTPEPASRIAAGR